MQLVLRGHKTKREADYGSKKIGYSLSQKKREKKGSKAQERPKSLSPRLCVGQLCTPRLAKRYNRFGQFMKEHSEVRTIWLPFVALTHDIIPEILSFYRWPTTVQIDNVYCCSVLLLVERLWVGQLCTLCLAKRHNALRQYLKEYFDSQYFRISCQFMKTVFHNFSGMAQKLTFSSEKFWSIQKLLGFPNEVEFLKHRLEIHK